MAQAEWQSSTELIEAARRILAAEFPMTIRQLFYRLVSLPADFPGRIPNTKQAYVRVVRLMTRARLEEDHRIDWKWIVDRSRSEYMPNVWDDAREYGETIRAAYRKDYWTLQPRHVEIWCEKDAVVGSIEPVTRELGVRLVPAKGYNSTTRMHEIGERLLQIDQQGKPIYIYFVGDFDPSGADIDRDLTERITQHAPGLSGFDFARLAIFKSDIRTFRLPSMNIKSSDPRAEKFRRLHGSRTVELDALPPAELRHRIREAIERHINRAAWDRAIMVEEAELRSIQDFADRLNEARE